MSDIPINAVDRRAQFTGNTGTGPFAFTFNILTSSDIAVFKNSTQLTVTSDYTVSINSNGTGSVTLTGSNNGTALVASDLLTIVGGRQLARTTDFVTAGDLLASSLNEQLDSNVIMVQQLDEKFSRALRINQFDETADMTIPDKATRAGKVFSFDSNGLPTATEGKVSSVSASVSAVSPGGSPTASATFTASTGALALAFGLVTGATGATGNSAGLQMTFNNSTSDADPGAGKLALNNATLASVTEIYFDDVDDNAASIATFIQSFDDVSNSTARGIIHIEKEGTPATFALFKVTGAVTNASGYTKVPVGHLVSNGSFSNSDGIRVDFSYSGSDGSAGGGLSDVVGDTTPQLGGDLDMNGQDIVTTSNADIELNPNGTGKTVLKGNTNPGTIVFNCESNLHGQTVKSQPHSAGVTNSLTLPPGGDGELVSTVATQQLTNKTIPDDEKLFFGTGNDGYIEYDENGDDRLKIGGTNIEFEKAVIGKTDTDTSNSGSVTLDFATNQNFVLTLTGAVTLANPTTELVGQTGFIVFIQDGTGGRAVSLDTQYKTVGGVNTLTLSSAANAIDIVPYVVSAADTILLGASQLAFS